MHVYIIDIRMNINMNINMWILMMMNMSIKREEFIGDHAGFKNQT